MVRSRAALRHRFEVGLTEARRIQEQLRRRLVPEDRREEGRHLTEGEVAGHVGEGGTAPHGGALRTRTGIRPVYVSVGHRVSLVTARRLVLRLAPRYRLPEPIWAAHAEGSRLRAAAEPEEVKGSRTSPFAGG